MQLIFDDLQELKDFIQEFLGESTPAPAKKSGAVATLERPVVAARAEVTDIAEAPRRGRPPKEKAAMVSKPVAKTNGKAAPAKKAANSEPSRRRDGLTLTDRIRGIIDKFVADGKSFSANAVYDEISKKDKDVNKQSVITSVLKQMTTNYTHINWVEAEGNGPRKIKLYNANKK
jgi:hypothetical protein